MEAVANRPIDYNELPLVYACSGCSSAAQLANDLALKLDHQGHGEMSCIAGVGGGVRPLLRKALSGRPLLVLDGCPLHCARHCLEQHGIEIDEHIDLSQHGVRKTYHARPLAEDKRRVWRGVVLPAASRLIAVSRG